MVLCVAAGAMEGLGAKKYFPPGSQEPQEEGWLILEVLSLGIKEKFLRIG